MAHGLDKGPEKRAAVRDGISQGFADLVGDDQQRRAGDIAGHDRAGDILDQVGHPQKRANDQEHPHQEKQQG